MFAATKQSNPYCGLICLTCAKGCAPCASACQPIRAKAYGDDDCGEHISDIINQFLKKPTISVCWQHRRGRIECRFSLSCHFKIQHSTEPQNLTKALYM